MATIIIRRTLDKKPYRLKCRFKTDPYPTKDRLDREKVRIAEWFVVDMHKEGWEHDNRYPFVMKGPFPMVVPTTIRPVKVPTAREMLPYIMNGARFPDKGRDYVSTVPPLAFSEYWEFEVAGVFVREQVMTELPDVHEEIH